MQDTTAEDSKAGFSRIVEVTIDEEQWGRFLYETNDFNEMVLTKRPYSRFIVADCLQKTLGHQYTQLIINAVQSHQQGAVFIKYPHVDSSLCGHLKLATAFAYLLGHPYRDEMTQKYFAAIHLTTDTLGDSFLSEPYEDLRLHTDGTFYKKSVEWVILSKVIQRNIQGGELSLHHLYDLPELEELLQHSLAFSPFLFEASTSKNVGGVCSQSVFFKTNGQLSIRFSDQFAYPQNKEEAFFLHQLSEYFENSSYRLVDPFPVGQLVILNNAFWLHGRLKINNKSTFIRQLLRIRGSFSNETH